MFHSFKVKKLKVIWKFACFGQLFHLVLICANPIMLIHSDNLSQKPNRALNERVVSSVAV